MTFSLFAHYLDQWISTLTAYIHNGLGHQLPGVNFTNILRKAFMLVYPESVKKIQLSHQYLFMLLGPESLKAVRKM